MNEATIQRANYISEAVYFIPAGDYRIESMAPDFTARLVSAEVSSATLQAVLDNHAVLTVNATKASIAADGADTVGFSIAGQTAFSYRLMRENILIEEGAVNDGVLEFASDDPALYTVELKVGNSTGYAQVAVIDG